MMNGAGSLGLISNSPAASPPRMIRLIATRRLPTTETAACSVVSQPGCTQRYASREGADSRPAGLPVGSSGPSTVPTHDAAISDSSNAALTLTVRPPRRTAWLLGGEHPVGADQI